MRFIENGPIIPDELLIARDFGDVIFFCGAGVSQHQAKLPGFAALAEDIVRLLGSARNSPARRLLAKTIELGSMAGVGGLVATDRIFGLLQREFESVDVRAAIAAAIKPKPGYELGAHQTLIDLATCRGKTRLVTTNFDLLFEECAPYAQVSGPPRLPDPRDDKAFDGIVHLHGRVDASYSQAQDDELVISSAEFDRAYLADGWATRFIQDLLVRFHIVFVGYSADDPPVQYLLEALNLRSGGPKRLYAFQAGSEGEATALWEHRGVQAIAFDSAGNYAALWDTLAAWAERNRDIAAWYDRTLKCGSAGPQSLSAFERGQIARALATVEGAKRLAASSDVLDARWLLVVDAAQRYAKPFQLREPDDAKEMFEPFDQLGVDEDIVPKPYEPRDRYAERRAPQGALNLLGPNSMDRGAAAAGEFAGLVGLAPHAALPPRLASLGQRLRRLAPEWQVRDGETIADSRAPVVYSIETDYSPDPLLNLPLADILPRVRQLGERDYLSRVQLEPFRGLAAQRPARALAALTLASRTGEPPGQAWKDFLSADARLSDSLRLITVITGRLCRLEPGAVAEIAYAISGWMETVADRLYGDAARLADQLWACVVSGLQISPLVDDDREKDWATPALNAPVAKLVSFLLKDPRKNDLRAGAGFPQAWLQRAEDLIALPGDWRRHALVLLGHQMTWLYAVDPQWTAQRLLPWLQASEADRNALWEGALWAGRIPQSGLFRLVKEDLILYATRASVRKEYSTNIAGFILGGWATEPRGHDTSTVIDNAEFREIILAADNTFRDRLLWQLWRSMSDGKEFWLPKVVVFLRDVWPKQRALRLPGISARLANIALASGDRMPEIVALILPRLIKLRTTTMIMVPDRWLDESFELEHPSSVLDLFWAILPDEASQWPFKSDAIVRKLNLVPSLSSDQRLGELRRRLDDRG